jgi:hypothetical protein
MECALLFILLAGALGALSKDIIQDNSLKLPKKTGEDFSLGFIGGMVTGALAAYAIDGNPTTAFLAGYTGTALIENLLLKGNEGTIQKSIIIETLIRKIAKDEGVDEELAVKVAKCESSLNNQAVNTNKDGSRDRGLYQINDRWHPEVTDAQAFDAVFSINFFCKAVKENHLDWWCATKDCWQK